jgi:hypothetical protein
MFVASFLTFMTIGGFPSFVEDMKVCCVLALLNYLSILSSWRTSLMFTSVKSFTIVISNYQNLLYLYPKFQSFFVSSLY